MFRKLASPSAMLVACALAACGGGGTTNNAGAGNPMPAMAGHAMAGADELAFTATVPGNTVGEELPEEGVGTSNHKPWGKVGGFTQTQRAQTLAFPPGTVITIRNLSKTNEHTFNFIKAVDGPPAHFPVNVNFQDQRAWKRRVRPRLRQRPTRARCLRESQAGKGRHVSGRLRVSLRGRYAGRDRHQGREETRTGRHADSRFDTVSAAGFDTDSDADGSPGRRRRQRLVDIVDDSSE